MTTSGPRATPWLEAQSQPDLGLSVGSISVGRTWLRGRIKPLGDLRPPSHAVAHRKTSARHGLSVGSISVGRTWLRGSDLSRETTSGPRATQWLAGKRQPGLGLSVGSISVGRIWLRGSDLNRRPPGYEPDELPGCSTPRLKYYATYLSSATRLSAIISDSRSSTRVCPWQSKNTSSIATGFRSPPE